MAWTDLEFDFGSILTSSKMTNLQANFQAMADGDSGAPEITADAMASNSVTTASIKTSTGGTSGTLNTNGEVDIDMQEYCFFPDTDTSTLGQNYIVFSLHTAGGTGYTGRFGFNNQSSDYSLPYTVNWRYITASDKPFIYFIRDKKTGELLHTWWCDDPPPGYWHLSDEEKANIENNPVDGWDYPISIKSWEDTTHESFVKFDYPNGMDLFREWTAKAKSDKIHVYKHLSDNFDFDTDTKLFKPKNITEI